LGGRSERRIVIWHVGSTGRRWRLMSRLVLARVLLGPEHLEAFADHLDLGPLLPVALPCFLFEAARNQYRRAFAEILIGDFGSAAPKNAVEKAWLFNPLIAALHP